jgi:hypothetical protein
MQTSSSDREFVLCSIVTRSHLARARVLASSLREHHPSAQVLVAVTDGDDTIAQSAEPFRILPIAELAVPEWRQRCFQYDALELCCAVKPHLLAHAFRHLGAARAVYADADLLICAPIDALLDRIQSASIVLTPHLVDRRDDERQRGTEFDCLATSGSYNAGLIGLRRDATSNAFLDWWAGRLDRGAVHAPARGLYFDQRWLDLVPGLFPDVAVFRHRGYNVSYWRHPLDGASMQNGRLIVEGGPVCVYHFTGFDVDLGQFRFGPGAASATESDALAQISREYQRKLIGAGNESTMRTPYGHGAFDNGVPIPKVARTIYWELDRDVARFGDPFRTATSSSFWTWLNEPAQPGAGVTRLWHAIYHRRPDLQRWLPDITGRDRATFLDWATSHGRDEHAIDSRFPLTGGVTAGVE